MSDVQDKREFFGMVMRALATVYGRPSHHVSMRLLTQATGGKPSQVTEALAYLVERGHAQQAEKEPGDTLPPAYWRATAQGVQLANDLIKDPMVQI